MNKISNNHETATDIYTVLCAAFCGTGKTYICEKTDIKAVGDLKTELSTLK